MLKKRTWVGKSSGLQEDVVKCAFALHELLNGRYPHILHAAAQATVGQLEEFF